MKRDPDLIRQILLAVEEKNNLDQLFPTNLGITGWDNADIDYHALLLIEAGYLEGKATPMGQGNVMVVIKRLTWEGHEFLDAARDDGRWAKAKSAISKAGGWSFEVLKPILVELAKEAIKTSLGLP